MTQALVSTKVGVELVVCFLIILAAIFGPELRRRDTEEEKRVAKRQRREAERKLELKNRKANTDWAELDDIDWHEIEIERSGFDAHYTCEKSPEKSVHWKGR